MIMTLLACAGVGYASYRIGCFEKATKNNPHSFINRVRSAWKEAADAVDKSWSATAPPPTPQPQVQPNAPQPQQQPQPQPVPTVFGGGSSTNPNP